MSPLILSLFRPRFSPLRAVFDYSRQTLKIYYILATIGAPVICIWLTLSWKGWFLDLLQLGTLVCITQPVQLGVTARHGILHESYLALDLNPYYYGARRAKFFLYIIYLSVYLPSLTLHLVVWMLPPSRGLPLCKIGIYSTPDIILFLLPPLYITYVLSRFIRTCRQEFLRVMDYNMPFYRESLTSLSKIEEGTKEQWIWLSRGILLEGWREPRTRLSGVRSPTLLLQRKQSINKLVSPSFMLIFGILLLTLEPFVLL